MECVFKLFNGKYKESGQGSSFGDYDAPTVKTMILPCNTDQWTTNHDFGNPLPLFQYIYAQRDSIRSLKNAFGRYALTLNKDVLDGVYGEYNLALSQVNYQYCGANGRVDGEPIDRVCETDFAVTKPYLAQKSSFGLTPKATDINLEGFMDIQGNELVTKTDLDKIMVLDGETYNGGNAVKTMMSSFITKYKKLALTAKTLSDGTKVSKVPGQNIFILSKTNGDITISEKNDLGNYDKPFTMIIEGGANLIIEGSLTKTNGMFLVK